MWVTRIGSLIDSEISLTDYNIVTDSVKSIEDVYSKYQIQI